MNRAALFAALGIAGLIGFGAFRMVKGKVTILDVPTSSTSGEVWRAPQKYAATIRAAEGQHAIPSGLLERQLYQESRYRDDIVTGQTVSSAGAVGIAQIIPRWHPNVNPLDWSASIFYAANYMAYLRRKFGSWPKALAAYNWGEGNLSRVNLALANWLSQVPTETRNYVNQITKDVPA